MSRRKLAVIAGIPAALVVAVVVIVFVSGVFVSPKSHTGSWANGASPTDSGAPADEGSPSPSASPSKPAPSHSASATPGPQAGRGGSCGLPKYPKPGCTGVPAGAALADLPLNVGGDSYAVRTAGAVIDHKHIHGNLLIWADNVTVKNTQIDGTVYNDQGKTYHPYTIMDSTVGLANKCVTQPGLLWANYTARRVKVLGHDDGFRVDAPGRVQIYDSYAKLCWNPPALAPPDGSHSGGIQAECGDGVCYNSAFVHNTIDNRGPNGNSGMTWMSFDGNPTSGWTANDNLVMGGTYTVIFWWTQGPNYEVHNNRVVKGEWAYGPTDARNSCAHQNWSGNTLVTINNDYDITSTVGQLSCVN
jgi:hypothetical protein